MREAASLVPFTSGLSVDKVDEQTTSLEVLCSYEARYLSKVSSTLLGEGSLPSCGAFGTFRGAVSSSVA